MSKPTSFSLIQKTFSDRDYELLSTSDSYKNNKTKLKYKCNNHSDKGVLEITWTDISQGHGCYYCGREKQSKIRSLDYSFVKDKFEKINYVLLEEKYVNSRTPMKYICNAHPNVIQTTTYGQVSKGSACHYCRYEKMSGSNHYCWKGGISTLYDYLRHRIHEWKFESLKQANFKCSITGISKDLEVHHLYSFDNILNDTLAQLCLPVKSKLNGYTDKELKSIEDRCLEIHFEHGLGAVLNKEVHMEFHMIYGYGENTPEQFEEFKCNYKSANKLVG